MEEFLIIAILLLVFLCGVYVGFDFCKEVEKKKVQKSAKKYSKILKIGEGK